MLGLYETVEFNTFGIHTENKGFYSKHGRYPCFQIACDDPEEVLGKDEIITHAKKATVIFNYPLSGEFKFEFKNSQGKITRREFALFIQSTYHNIYNNESTKPVGNIPGMNNRLPSDGPYGIWGHYIEDLVIEGVQHIGDDVYVLHIGS